MCIKQNKKNLGQFKTYEDQLVAEDFEIHSMFACLEHSCKFTALSDLRKQELACMNKLFIEYGVMYSFDLKGAVKVKVSNIPLLLREDLKRRPMVLPLKRGMVEVVKEHITPQLVAINESVAAVKEDAKKMPAFWDLLWKTPKSF